MPAAREPEIIPPAEWERRQRAAQQPASPANPFWAWWSAGPLNDANLERLAALLDDGFRVPGTTLRFGLDPIVGLLPGFGDAVMGIAGFVFVYAAWRRGLPKVTLARMVANLAVDAVVGTLPVLGDLFDVFWKSNRKNLKLLQRSRRGEPHQTWRDWLFFAVLVLVLAGLALLPLLLLVWLVHLLRR